MRVDNLRVVLLLAQAPALAATLLAAAALGGRGRSVLLLKHVGVAELGVDLENSVVAAE